MKSIAISLAIVLTAFYGISQAFDCDTDFRHRTTTADGTEVGLIITRGQIKRAPKWTPDDGEPILSVSDAIAIAANWAERHYTRFDSVKVDRISLDEYVCGGVQGRWFYTIGFTPIIQGNEVFGGGNFAAVLMDGTLIEPTNKQ